MMAAFPASLPARPPPAGPAAGVTALVFGREESGLLETELRLCSHACSLPSGRLQPSLNLSHAVAVVLSQLFERRLERMESVKAVMSSGAKEVEQGEGVAAEEGGSGATSSSGAAAQQHVTGRSGARGQEPAAASEVESLLQRCAAIAEAAGSSGGETTSGANHGRKRLPVGHIRALLARAQVQAWEVRSLHGLASAVLAALRAERPQTLGEAQHSTGDLEKRQSRTEQ